MAFFDMFIRRYVENAHEANLAAASASDERRLAQLDLRRRALNRVMQEIEEEMRVLQRRIQYDKDLYSDPIEGVG
jgi:hypothetical protein